MALFGYKYYVHRRSTRTDQNWWAFVSTARAQEKHRESNVNGSDCDTCRTGEEGPSKHDIHDPSAVQQGHRGYGGQRRGVQQGEYNAVRHHYLDHQNHQGKAQPDLRTEEGLVLQCGGSSEPRSHHGNY